MSHLDARPAEGALARLAEIGADDARHRRLLRVGFAAALWFHLGLLVVPLPQDNVAEAEEEVPEIVHLVPIPRFEPPEPTMAPIKQPAAEVPVPEVFLAEPVREVEEVVESAIVLPPDVVFIEPAPPPPPPEPRGPLVVGGAIAQPARLVYVEPEYPRTALVARLEGMVILQVLLDRGGVVTSVTVLRPGSMGFTESAVAAVRQWRYEPAMLEGRPVEALMSVTVHFRLR